jgi:hypothetical protein
MHILAIFDRFFFCLLWARNSSRGGSSQPYLYITGFKQFNIHKAAGPDGLPGRVLRACTDQLASVFTDIFNLFLTESVLPTCFKQTTIVPVPKIASVNNYRPVEHEVL